MGWHRHLATDRALLAGVPGARAWVSEHLAAASAATHPAGARHVRHHGRAAALRVELRPPAHRRPTAPALVLKPGAAGDGTWRHRAGGGTHPHGDVQEHLVTVLSEKSLPVPELAYRGAGRSGLAPHCHGQRPHRGVNDPAQRPPPVQHGGAAAAGGRGRRGPHRPTACRELGPPPPVPPVPTRSCTGHGVPQLRSAPEDGGSA